MTRTLELTDAESNTLHPVGPVQLTPDPLIGSDVGGYLVEALLGEGGMGLVFRARHPILNRHFAIKILRPEAAADARISMNFEREAQTLSSLKHPHIIDIVGFGVLADGRQYMVMEFVKGQTLYQELEQGGQLELHRALKLADQILDGLDAAHSVGVIHRDLKPSNVLIAKVSGGSEVLKLLDFGLAKQQPESLVGRMVGAAAGESIISGTPEYMAPEQAQGKHAGKHSDLYSFGIVFFEMLTGVRPFEVDNDTPNRVRTLLEMHLHQRAPLISVHTRAGYFPLELEELVADLLNKNPIERPSSAATVRARLQKVQRTLQKEATSLVANPLLGTDADSAGPPVKRHLQTEPVIRIGAEEPSSPATAGAQTWRAAVLFGAVVVLLSLGGAWWLRGRAVPGPRPIEEIAIAVAPPAPLQPAPDTELVELPAPDPDPQAPESEELAPLKARRLHPVPIATAGCAPDAAWKKRSRADLNELVTRAAKLNDDLSLWAAYREGPLSSAIEAATSVNDCGSVNLQLAAFKLKVKSR